MKLSSKYAQAPFRTQPDLGAGTLVRLEFDKGRRRVRRRAPSHRPQTELFMPAQLDFESTADRFTLGTDIPLSVFTRIEVLTVIQVRFIQIGDPYVNILTSARQKSQINLRK